jgi:putative Mg2+ transporter-C (MgtC) family protein
MVQMAEGEGQRMDAAMPTDILIQLQTLAKAGLACTLGGLIGLEREIADKPAGFRTHMMVAGVAALIIGLSEPLMEWFASRNLDDTFRPDPFRLFEAIITGVAFLGAGTILRPDDGGSVTGLTTAGSILMSAVVGICVALDQYILGVGMTGLTLLLLKVMHFLEVRIGKKKK